MPVRSPRPPGRPGPAGSARALAVPTSWPAACVEADPPGLRSCDSSDAEGMRRPICSACAQNCAESLSSATLTTRMPCSRQSQSMPEQGEDRQVSRRVQAVVVDPVRSRTPHWRPSGIQITAPPPGASRDFSCSRVPVLQVRHVLEGVVEHWPRRRCPSRPRSPPCGRWHRSRTGRPHPGTGRRPPPRACPRGAARTRADPSRRRHRGPGWPSAGQPAHGHGAEAGGHHGDFPDGDATHQSPQHVSSVQDRPAQGGDDLGDPRPTEDRLRIGLEGVVAVGFVVTGQVGGHLGDVHGAAGPALEIREGLVEGEPHLADDELSLRAGLAAGRTRTSRRAHGPQLYASRHPPKSPRRRRVSR